MTVPLGAWPLTLVVVALLANFLIGMRCIAIIMSNPFGDDQLDFDVELIMDGVYAEAIAQLSFVAHTPNLNELPTDVHRKTIHMPLAVNEGASVYLNPTPIRKRNKPAGNGSDGATASFSGFRNVAVKGGDDMGQLLINVSGAAVSAVGHGLMSCGSMTSKGLMMGAAGVGQLAAGATSRASLAQVSVSSTPSPLTLSPGPASARTWDSRPSPARLTGELGGSSVAKASTAEVVRLDETMEKVMSVTVGKDAPVDKNVEVGQAAEEDAPVKLEEETPVAASPQRWITTKGRVAVRRATVKTFSSTPSAQAAADAPVPQMPAYPHPPPAPPPALPPVDLPPPAMPPYPSIPTTPSDPDDAKAILTTP